MMRPGEIIKVILVLFLLTGFRFFVCAQSDTAGYLIVVADRDTYLPVPMAEVVVLSNGKRHISRLNGQVRIKALPSDSVILFHHYYFPAKHALKGDTIYLKRLSVLLGEVLIKGNRYNDSLAKVAADILRTDSVMNNHKRVTNRPRSEIVVGPGYIGISGPIDYIYQLLSQEGKQNRAYERHIRQMQVYYMIKEKVSNREISEVTGIKEPELQEFIDWCAFTNKQLLETSKVEILQMFKNKSVEFKKQKGTGR